MTYWRLHYHLIWATFEREPTLTPEREKMFYGVLYNKAKELGVKIHAAGNVEDHAHVVASIPPKLAVADCVPTSRARVRLPSITCQAAKGNSNGRKDMAR